MFLLAEAVLTSTHNLRFRAKLRKKGIPLQIPVFLYKNGIQWVYFSWTCFPDGINRQLLETTQTNCFETVSKEKKNYWLPPGSQVAAHQVPKENRTHVIFLSEISRLPRTKDKLKSEREYYK